MLHVGYIVVIYRYQAFSFSLSSHKNEMLDQASAGSTHHGSWLQYVYCQVVLKLTWNHYVPSNLNFSLQGSYHYSIRIYYLVSCQISNQGGMGMGWFVMG